MQRENGLKPNGPFGTGVALTLGRVARAPGVVGAEPPLWDVKRAHPSSFPEPGGARRCLSRTVSTS